MNWIHIPHRPDRNFELSLPLGTVCWVYSEDTQRCHAAVHSKHGWRRYGQEHFCVPGVIKYIVLPTK